MTGQSHRGVLPMSPIVLPTMVGKSGNLNHQLEVAPEQATPSRLPDHALQINLLRSTPSLAGRPHPREVLGHPPGETPVI